MNIAEVLAPSAFIIPLFKKDLPRQIDELIDYFGEGRPPALPASNAVQPEPATADPR